MMRHQAPTSLDNETEKGNENEEEISGEATVWRRVLIGCIYELLIVVLKFSKKKPLVQSEANRKITITQNITDYVVYLYQTVAVQ